MSHKFRDEVASSTTHLNKAIPPPNLHTFRFKKNSFKNSHKYSSCTELI